MSVAHDLKTFATIAGNKKTICLLLAMLLAVSNMAYSAHVSRHNATDTGFCSLCIHPGSPNSAITTQAGALFTGFTQPAPIHSEPAFRFPGVARCAHQSRAPPRTV